MNTKPNCRVLFIPSNETHVGWMLPIAKKIDGSNFMIFPERKENADFYLNRFGLPFHTYQKGRIQELNPAAIVLGNDWALPERHCVQEARLLKIPSICIQEGPLNFFDKNGPRLQNAEHVFLHGPRMLRFLNRRKNCLITGNPKYDSLRNVPLPAKPTVMINANFTYNVFEEIRNRWVGEVVGACKDLGVDFFISQHPRDKGKFPADWNVIPSDAFQIQTQLEKSSILITRFSTVIYEALFLGREVLYFNPHGEPFRIFSEDDTGGIFLEERWGHLRESLAKTLQSLGKTADRKRRFLLDHCETLDGDAAQRCVEGILEICEKNPRPLDPERTRKGCSFCIITEGKNPEKLQLTIASIRAQQTEEKEILVVGNYRGDDDIVYVPASEESLRNDLGGMRNLAVERARFGHIVFLEEGVILTPNWTRNFHSFSEDFDIMTSRVRLPDGTRYWDHAALLGNGERTLLNFGDDLPPESAVYLGEGGVWAMKRETVLTVRWNDRLRSHLTDDADFSKACQEKRVRVRYNPRCVAYYNNATYSRLGRRVHRRIKATSVSWIKDRPELQDAEAILQHGLERGRLGEFVEFADCMRAGMILYPSDPKIELAWNSFLGSVGGDVVGDCWYMDGDPYFRWLQYHLGFAPPGDSGAVALSKTQFDEAEAFLNRFFLAAADSAEKAMEFVSEMADTVPLGAKEAVYARREEAHNELDQDSMVFWDTAVSLFENLDSLKATAAGSR